MAFRSLDFRHLSKFNSAITSELLSRYVDFVDKKILSKYDEASSKTFSPSNFRCDRRCWFRLRGVQPDRPAKGDQVLQFTADLGTAIHLIVQRNLKEVLCEDWIDVGEYLKTIYSNPEDYEITQDAFETKVKIYKPYPIQFACDGIIRLKDMLYILEIKSSDHKAFDELIEQKTHHKDQLQFESQILKIPNGIFLYVDRQYGEMKSYEVKYTESDWDFIERKLERVTRCAESTIAPERLDFNDPFCNGCLYKRKCREWG